MIVLTFFSRSTYCLNYNRSNISLPFQISKVHFCCCFLTFFHVPIASAASSLTWTDDISYPIAVSFAVALTGQDHCIYVFCGQNSSGDATSSSYKFNVTAGSPRGWFHSTFSIRTYLHSDLIPLHHLEWTAIASMPTGVFSATGCVANDGRFFIFGGLKRKRKG